MAELNQTNIKPTQTLGSPVGNPGYSLAAPTFNAQTGSYEGGGATWVGAEGGDTQENRDSFTSWIGNNSIIGDGNLQWANEIGGATPQPSGDSAPLSNIGSTPTISELSSSAPAPATQSNGELTLGGAPGTTSTNVSAQSEQAATGPSLQDFLSTPDPQALQKMAAAGLGSATIQAMAGVNSGDPTAWAALSPEDQAKATEFVQSSMPASAYNEWMAIAGGSQGGSNGTQSEWEQLANLSPEDAAKLKALKDAGLTNEQIRQLYGTGGENPGVNTGAPNSNVGSDNANLNFTDQGDGVYRGWKSQGPSTAVNTTQADGSVQGNFQDTRGNEFRADFATAENAAADANNREMTDAERSSQTLNDILSQDSPLMALARQDGIKMANNRGLSNSSLAAGASMAEMTRQATPLAMQEAEGARDMESQNQQLESSRLEQNAGREQQANLFNAETETNTNITNAGMANDMLNSDRQRSMSYNLQQLAGDQDFAKQNLASEKAIDLANVEGQYKMLISENDTAARMFDSTYQSIADIMGNSEIYADEASAKVNYLVQNMQAMMESLLAFDNFDFEASTSTGAGKTSDFGP